MLCINLTDAITQKSIVINEKLIISRMYLSSIDIPSFPNRLVFKASEIAITPLLELIIGCLDRDDEVDAELFNEIALLSLEDNVNIIVPFALRVKDEVYTSFYQRQKAVRENENVVKLTVPEYQLFIHGTQVATPCIACNKQATLHGRRCPDFSENNFACFKTNRFQLEPMDTFYINNKGEMIYNAASVSSTGDEKVEDIKDISTSSAEDTNATAVVG